jgi:head-tail adaptor
MAIDLATGNRKYRIAFERATIGRDAMNAQTETWGEVGKRWAAISFATGQERRTAAQETGSAAATFAVLKDSLTSMLVIRDRIQFDGAWDIISIVPAGDLNEGIEITAVRAS